MLYVFFFFSSRRRHTRLRRDWSSDVCSSDLVQETRVQHGDEVALGAVLVRLRNTELDYEARRLVGDLATTQAKLRAVQAARLTAGGDRLRTDQVNADVERYKTILEGMQQQHEIIKRRSEERRGGKECRSRWSPYH